MTDTKVLEEWLRPTLQKENLENCPIQISGNSEKGDGYVGDITFVEIGENSQNFVIKSGKKSKELRKLMPIRVAFENEINFYTKVLPEFIKFQKDRQIEDRFDNVPKCYDTLLMEDMEVLILQNLKKDGFEVYDRTKPMDREHINKVIESYGKLHAISFAIRDQNPALFSKLGNYFQDFFLKLNERMADRPHPQINFCQNLINAAEEEGESEVVEKCSILNTSYQTIHNLTDPKDPYSVIVHGDCWNNNFMFKKTGSELDVCFIDFQLSRLASPVYDLSYFLFTCLSEKDAKDFDAINCLYYEAFSKFLRRLGSDPLKLFPFDELINQWKRFSIFGLVMMPTIIKLCVSEQDEVPDLAEAAESGNNLGEKFVSVIKRSDDYKKRTLPIMKLAIKKGFI